MLKLIPEADTLLPVAYRVIEKLDEDRTQHYGIFKRVHKSKARLHTWLAWHDTPGESMSVAIQKHFFATNKDLCLQFCQWIDALN